jgi:hypothetical protein
MNKESIIERHTIEVSEGIKKLDLINLLLELEARQKGVNVILEEVKEVLAGQAKWAETIELRVKKLEPTIQIFSEHEATNLLK